MGGSEKKEEGKKKKGKRQQRGILIVHLQLRYLFLKNNNITLFTPCPLYNRKYLGDLSCIWAIKSRSNLVAQSVWCYTFNKEKHQHPWLLHTPASPDVGPASEQLLENQCETSFERKLHPPWLSWFSHIFFKEVTFKLIIHSSPNGPKACQHIYIMLLYFLLLFFLCGVYCINIRRKKKMHYVTVWEKKYFYVFFCYLMVNICRTLLFCQILCSSQLSRNQEYEMWRSYLIGWSSRDKSVTSCCNMWHV